MSFDLLFVKLPHYINTRIRLFLTFVNIVFGQFFIYERLKRSVCKEDRCTYQLKIVIHSGGVLQFTRGPFAVKWMESHCFNE